MTSKMLVRGWLMCSRPQQHLHANQLCVKVGYVCEIWEEIFTANFERWSAQLMWR